MGTYLIAYEEALTQIIETGGLQEVVDKAVDDYNTFRRASFDAWLKVADLKCIHCGNAADKEAVEPLEEITCKEHRPEKTDAAPGK